MEENKEQNDTNENTDKVDPIEPIAPIIEHESKTDKENTGRKNSTDTQNSKSDSKNIFTPDIKNNKLTVADKIGLAQTAFNFLTTGATFFLLLFAFQQNRISEDNYKLAKETFDKGQIESDKRYKLDSANLNAQIQSLKEQVNLIKNQFETENLPYLKTDFFSVDRQQSQPWRFRVNISNIGKYPAKIVSTKIKVSVQANAFNSQTFFQGIKSKTVSFYVMDKYSFPIEMTYDSLKGTDAPEYVLKGKKDIYFAGEIIYFNLVTTKMRKVEFVYKSIPGPYFNMEQIKLENYPIE